MNQGKLILIKIGGSVIAPKLSGKKAEMRKDILKNIYEDVKKLKEEGYRVGIVFGGGNYAHSAVYDSHIIRTIQNLREEGEFDRLIKQLERRGKTLEQAVNEVNEASTDLLNESIKTAREHGLELKRVIDPEHVHYRPEGKEYAMHHDAIEGFRHAIEHTETIPVGVGMIVSRDPTFYGLKHKICSADNLLEPLAKELEPDMVIYATDVDGIYETNPQVNKSAELIPRGTFEKIEERVKSAEVTRIDATGGMLGKLQAIKKITEAGVPVRVINGTIKGNIYRAAKGEEIGTHVLPAHRPKA
ncbi:MAG: hypothetical protein JW834_03140 [Candidatus Diapherotrites archaeon]|nr:hypothetical protein [Candidatus Diapherotrites archaeon]